MKSTTLSASDRAVVQAIATTMMAMNDRNDVNASQSSTFGHLWNAIKAFVKNQTTIDISNVDWNLGGNASWVDDIQAAIAQAIDRDADIVVLECLIQAVPVRHATHSAVAERAAARLREEYDWTVAADELLKR